MHTAQTTVAALSQIQKLKHIYLKNNNDIGRRLRCSLETIIDGSVHPGYSISPTPPTPATSEELVSGGELLSYHAHDADHR